MDLIIQKAVELGAAKIVPVAMKRCVVKLDQKRSVPSEAVERHIGKRSQAGQKDDRSPGSSCHDL